MLTRIAGVSLRSYRGQDRENAHLRRGEQHEAASWQPSRSVTVTRSPTLSTETATRTQPTVPAQCLAQCCLLLPLALVGFAAWYLTAWPIARANATMMRALLGVVCRGRAHASDARSVNVRR
jgi:hypothetical protein